MTSNPDLESGTLERASWHQLQALLSSLNDALDATPDWAELSELHRVTRTKMLHRACPACLEALLVDDPYDPDPLFHAPDDLREPTVMLRPPHKHGVFYLPEKSGIMCRPGWLVVCEQCADSRTVDSEDVSFNDDHPLVGCSWQAAWSVCDVVIADDGARSVTYYRQTLAEVIAKVAAGSDSWSDVVDIRNFDARVSVVVTPELAHTCRGDADLPNADFLEQLAPAFFQLTAEGVDVGALREPANAWVQATDEVGSSSKAGDILNQVAEAVRTEDLPRLKDDLAVALYVLMWDTGKAVKWLRAMTADTLTVTPEAFRERFGPLRLALS